MEINSKAAQLYPSYRKEIETVETVTDAEKALQVAGQLMPAIILIDVKLLTLDSAYPNFKALGLRPPNLIQVMPQK
ncbi:MAG: hypothetical protein AB1767_04150 [Bacillota bacterium]